jgi:hypothetical protein
MKGPGRTGGPLQVMRDLVDGELLSSDGRSLGRVDDVVAVLEDDGSVRLVEIVTGPEALAGRVASRLRPLARRLLRGRLDSRIPLSEVDELGPTIRLRGPAASYRTGRSDQWIADHLLRWIPWSGR